MRITDPLFRALTGEQRYAQVMLKARLMAACDLRRFLAGEIDMLPCSGDRERAFMIAELDRVNTRD